MNWWIDESYYPGPREVRDWFYSAKMDDGTILSAIDVRPGKKRDDELIITFESLPRTGKVVEFTDGETVWRQDLTMYAGDTFEVRLRTELGNPDD